MDLIDSNDSWTDNPNMQTISDKGLAPSATRTKQRYLR
jgi:hypothetical protein